MDAEPLPRPFEALLCDLDGVLRVWDDGDVLDVEAEFGLAPGAIAAVAFAPERLLPAVVGVVDDDGWRMSVAAAFVPTHGVEAAADLVSRWSAPIGRVDEAVLELLEAVRKAGVPVLLVTNGTTRLEMDLAALGLDQAVDGVVNSARIGAVKPNPEIYLAAAEQANCPPQRCLLVDDTPANVEGALAVGMSAVRYTGFDSLREAIAPVLASPGQNHAS